MKCPYCNYKFDRQETIDGNSSYGDGDIAFCIECGKVGLFKGDKIIRTIETELPHDSQVEVDRMRNAWLKVDKK